MFHCFFIPYTLLSLKNYFHVNCNDCLISAFWDFLFLKRVKVVFWCALNNIALNYVNFSCIFLHHLQHARVISDWYPENTGPYWPKTWSLVLRSLMAVLRQILVLDMKFKACHTTFCTKYTILRDGLKVCFFPFVTHACLPNAALGLPKEKGANHICSFELVWPDK